MSLPLITDIQLDSLGSLFPPSVSCLQSPQSFQISSPNVQSHKVDVDYLLREVMYGANGSTYASDQGTFPQFFLDSDTAEHHPHIYGSQSPSVVGFPLSHHPATSEFDSGSTPSLIGSPTAISPMSWPGCVCGCGSGPCLFQRPYRRPKGDPLEDDRRGELVIFQVHGRCGIPLRDALRCKYGGLSGRDDPMFVGSRTSISIRIEWPDHPSWAQQMRTKDWKRKPSPITKAKLATEVAKKVNRFLEDNRGRNHRGSQRDTLSPCHVDFDRLVLVALEHVSLASWQPHLRLI